MSRTLCDECKSGNVEEVQQMILNGANVNMTNDGKGGGTPLYVASCNGHLEIVKVLIANKANFFYMNNEGKTPLDVASTNEIRQCIINHPWYRRRPLLLTRPHVDHETNEEHDVTSLGAIITAKGIADPSSEDSVLYQLKMKVALFL